MKKTDDKNKKQRSNRLPKIVKPTECYFTQSKTEPNYKEVLILRRFISERGKVLPQKITGLTSKNQRKLSQEIKKARFMALLPFTDKHSI